MKAMMIAVVLCCIWTAHSRAAEPQVDYGDPGVIVPIPIGELWRDASRSFVGRQEDGKLVFTYAFRDEPGDPAARPYSRCPAQNYADASRAISCEAAADAIVQALRDWAHASGRLEFRRSAPGSAPNIWIAFASPDVWRRIQPFREGEAAIASASLNIDHRINETFVYFNRDFCWHLGDESVCPQRRAPYRDSDRLMVGHLPGVARHEIGHVLGFDHPERPTHSIMYKGDVREISLTDVDRRAVRILYDHVAASLGASR
ncbi:MAG: matrixin family metalloprotease [Elusimicrobia bacterium]|nr:matrixin family metalloprotease [Elusimicrobiota bacterium]